MIRTHDPLVPNQVHYQAVLCSDLSQLLLYRTSCGTVCILGATPSDVNTYCQKKLKILIKCIFNKHFEVF